MDIEVLNDLKQIAMKYNIEKIILFGSRAREDYSQTSDYDIAIFKSNLTPIEKAMFNDDIEELNTLKKIDVIFVDEDLTDEFANNIKKEGVIIYEQTRNQINKL